MPLCLRKLLRDVFAKRRPLPLLEEEEGRSANAASINRDTTTPTFSILLPSCSPFASSTPPPAPHRPYWSLGALLWSAKGSALPSNRLTPYSSTSVLSGDARRKRKDPHVRHLESRAVFPLLWCDFLVLFAGQRGIIREIELTAVRGRIERERISARRGFEIVRVGDWSSRFGCWRRNFGNFWLRWGKRRKERKVRDVQVLKLFEGFESFLMLCGRNFGNFWLRRMVKKRGEEGGLKGFGIVRVIFNVGCKKFLDKKDGKEIIRKIEWIVLDIGWKKF